MRSFLETPQSSKSQALRGRGGDGYEAFLMSEWKLAQFRLFDGCNLLISTWLSRGSNKHTYLKPVRLSIFSHPNKTNPSKTNIPKKSNQNQGVQSFSDLGGVPKHSRPSIPKGTRRTRYVWPWPIRVIPWSPPTLINPFVAWQFNSDLSKVGHHQRYKGSKEIILYYPYCFVEPFVKPIF